MSVVVSQSPESLSLPRATLRRFSVEEYHRMIVTGILAEDEPVELLEGWIVSKMPRNPLHDATIQVTTEAIPGKLSTGWVIRVQCAVTTEDSEPEPDIAVVRGTSRSYTDHHPGPAEIGILIEVADSSLEHDRSVKGPAYARAAIPVYWIINLPGRCVEVYTDPTGPDSQPGYRRRLDHREAETVPLILDGRQLARIPVRDLFP